MTYGDDLTVEHRRDLAMEQTTSGDVPGLQTPFFSIR